MWSTAWFFIMHAQCDYFVVVHRVGPLFGDCPAESWLLLNAFLHLNSEPFFPFSLSIIITELLNYVNSINVIARVRTAVPYRLLARKRRLSSTTSHRVRDIVKHDESSSMNRVRPNFTQTTNRNQWTFSDAINGNVFYIPFVLAIMTKPNSNGLFERCSCCTLTRSVSCLSGQMAGASWCAITHCVRDWGTANFSH